LFRVTQFKSQGSGEEGEEPGDRGFARALANGEIRHPFQLQYPPNSKTPQSAQKKSQLRLCALLLDGVEVKQQHLVTALGIDETRRKTILGFHQGASENQLRATVAEKQFRRIDGYRALPGLITALEADLKRPKSAARVA
jgi:hypothetical protein